jgi:uncharacterized membrane protein
MAQRAKAGRSDTPMDRLKSEAFKLVGALGDRAVSSVRDRVEGAAGRLTDYVDRGAGPGLMAAVTGAKDLAEGKGPVRSMLGAGMKAAGERIRGLFGKGGGKGKKMKVTNIVESIDVGVPVKVAYNQWTQFADFPSFMKKVENVEQADDQKLKWKAQVFWSHRTWESTILEQVPDDKIVWRSKGEKGHVDGAVTFHELAPNLTRILLELEYHPQGLFEHTGNLWRAQGRRARLEMKHFRRHVMSNVILHPDEVEGWRGVIHDGEVVEEPEADSGNGQRTNRRSRSAEGNGEKLRRSGGAGRAAAGNGKTRTSRSGKAANGSSSRTSRSGGSSSSRASRSGESSSSRTSRSGGSSSSRTGRSGGSSRSSGTGERAQRTSRRTATRGGESS